MKYTNYFKNHYSPLSDYQLRFASKYSTQNILPHLLEYKNDSTIIEIGSWQWKFAGFLATLWYKNHIWFELDNDMTENLKTLFPQYQFHSSDVLEYLEKNPNSIDVLFMSHVFEHFTRENWQKLLELIYSSLKEDGVFINVMPNASSLFMATYGRYNDVTHEVIYTENSFNHVLLNAWFNRDQVKHKNVYFVNPSWFIHIIGTVFQRGMLFFMKYFLILTGYPYERITTFEILTVAKK